MSVLTPFKRAAGRPKVHYSHYIRTENKPDDGGVNQPAKPAQPAQPDQPEAE